jgi:hypothetical protein
VDRLLARLEESLEGLNVPLKVVRTHPLPEESFWVTPIHQPRCRTRQLGNHFRANSCSGTTWTCGSARSFSMPVWRKAHPLSICDSTWRLIGRAGRS